VFLKTHYLNCNFKDQIVILLETYLHFKNHVLKPQIQRDHKISFEEKIVTKIPVGDAGRA
jgi:hypothetical protein